MRFVIDCLCLALKKMHLHCTHVITELEQEHRTGFLFYCIIANNAVSIPGTTDPVNHGGVPQNLCYHQVFLWEPGENDDDSKSE